MRGDEAPMQSNMNENRAQVDDVETERRYLRIVNLRPIMLEHQTFKVAILDPTDDVIVHVMD